MPGRRTERVHQLTRIYLACDQLDAAMDVLEKVLAVPYAV
jgi:hypothetical protein